MINLSLQFTWPLEEPELVFALVLFIILFSPILLNRFKIPSIIGLIIAGVLIGPNGLEVIASDEAFKLFGSVGLLYIMFLAGLEIDMNGFKRNKWRSIYFGMNTFIIPMVLGSIIGHYILGLGWMSAILLASMFASHTLLAYPAISKMGIVRLPIVNITVGGTMITDTLALIVLAVIAGMSEGEVDRTFWLTLGLSSLIFAIIVMVGFPILARWFFRKYEDAVSQYIFILALVYLAAFLAELAGLETIIGAFFAGLALNKLIPHTSPMMNRIEFVGNALFIPFFLISVGMLVDVRILIQGYEAIFFAVVMTVVALGAKWLAAWLTQKSFGWNLAERNLMFGLSSTQAAATLAVVFVGVNLGLFNDAILNGAIVMILITCLVGSYFAEKAGKEVVKIESQKPPEVENIEQRIMLSLHREDRVKSLIDFSALIRFPKSKENFRVVYVAQEGTDSEVQLIAGKKVLEKTLKYSGDYGYEIDEQPRVDAYISKGIHRAVNDTHSTEIVLGWSGNKDSEKAQFNQMLDQLIKINNSTIFIYKPVHPINTIKRILVTVPPNAEKEHSFNFWLDRIVNLAKISGNKLHIYCTQETKNALELFFGEKFNPKNVFYTIWQGYENILRLSQDIRNDDLLFVVSAREYSPAFSNSLISIPGLLCANFKDIDMVFVLPQTAKIENEENEIDKDSHDQQNWTIGYYFTGN